MSKFNLLDFCGYEDDPRTYLREPFVYGDYECATNGHMILFQPKGDVIKAMCGLQPANMASILEKINSAVYVDMPTITLPPKIPCNECNGIGRITRVPCEECETLGVVEFSNDHNDYEFDCKSCDGEGYNVSAGKEGNRCSNCNGTGTIYWTSLSAKPFPVLDKHVNAVYASMLIGKDGLQIGAADNMICFKYGDQFGAIMGMRV